MGQFPKVLIFWLSISVVSSITREKNSQSYSDGLNCTAECWQDREKLASIYKDKKSVQQSPCDDFYTYACENLKPLMDESSDDDGSYFVDFESIRLLLEASKTRQKIIKESLNSTVDILPNKLIKKLYKSCKNYESNRFSTLDINYLLKQLSELGGWPVLEGKKWNERVFDWKKIVIKSQSVDNLFDAFLMFVVDPRVKFNSISTSYNLQPSIFASEYVSWQNRNQTKLKAFHNLMVSVAVFLGADEEIAKKELHDSLEFELNLSITSPNKLSFLRSVKRQEMSVAEMTERWPAVNWTKFLTELTKSHIKFDNSVLIKITDIDYVDNFFKIIDKTPKRVQANYGLWKLIYKFIVYINNESLREMRQTALSIVFPYYSPEFETGCVEIVNKLLPLSIDTLYVRKYVDKRVKSIVTDIYDNIKIKSMELVKSADWLDQKTKKILIDKAENIRGLIAYPDELLDDLKVEEYYTDLDELVDDGYLENVLKLKKFNWIKRFRILEFGFDEYYRTHSNQTFAQASDIEENLIIPFNSLEMPAGYLRGLYFNVNYPSYINYGSVGTTLSYELSHIYLPFAYDDKTWKNKNDKWIESFKQQFQDRENCLIKQYNRSTPNGIKVDGHRTLNENLADNLGVKIAYLAYQDWVARNSPEQSLPGFSLTSNQLFWLSYANVFCVKYIPSNIESFLVNEDNHSPTIFRVNHVLSNLPEFSRDFNCPLGSGMNPENKCSLF